MSDYILNSFQQDEQTPDWRWDFVRTLTSEKRKPTRTTDRIVARAWRFLRRWLKSNVNTRMLLRQEFPDLYSAYSLYANPHSERWLIEAGLLSQADFKTIAQYVAVPESVVQIYSDLFYDIRDKRAARGYIANRILVPAATRGLDGRDFDFFLKTLSYFAGWEVMTQFVGDGALSEDTQAFLNQNFVNRMLKLGYVATHRLEVNNYNAIEVIEQCVKLRELEHSNRGPLSQNETWSVMEGLLRKFATGVEEGTQDHFEDGKVMETVTYPASEPRVLENATTKILAYGDPIPITPTAAVDAVMAKV